MDSDIETCYEDSSPTQTEEINFDLITRYYQTLMSQVENDGGEFHFLSNNKNN